MKSLLREIQELYLFYKISRRTHSIPEALRQAYHLRQAIRIMRSQPFGFYRGSPSQELEEVVPTIVRFQNGAECHFDTHPKKDKYQGEP